MTTKQESLDFKSVYVVIVTLSILALMFTVQPAALYASSNNDNDNDDDDCRDKPFPQDIACGLGDAASGYDNGYSAGKSAGINGDSRSCPESNSLSGYCLGWNDGYNDGADARLDMEKYQNNDNGDDNN